MLVLSRAFFLVFDNSGLRKETQKKIVTSRFSRYLIENEFMAAIE